MSGKKQTVSKVEIVADNNSTYALRACCPDIEDSPPNILRIRRDHLWMLGGEVIRRHKGNPLHCKLLVEKLIFDLLEEDGVPLIWPRITEQEQDTFDASCRKLYRFLVLTNAPLIELKIV